MLITVTKSVRIMPAHSPVPAEVDLLCPAIEEHAMVTKLSPVGIPDQ